MFSLSVLLALLCLRSVALVTAELFIIEPLQDTTCHAGKLCNVTWVDDGKSPFLEEIGVSTVALYTGNQQLIQTLSPVDVEISAGFNFTPLSGAGPNSDNYYIAFTSTELNVSGSPYIGFSAFFRLRGMTGSFSSPLPAATSSIPIPQSIKNPPASSAGTTASVTSSQATLNMTTSLAGTTASVTSSQGTMTTTVTIPAPHS